MTSPDPATLTDPRPPAAPPVTGIDPCHESASALQPAPVSDHDAELLAVALAEVAARRAALAWLLEAGLSSLVLV